MSDFSDIEDRQLVQFVMYEKQTKARVRWIMISKMMCESGKSPSKLKERFKTLSRRYGRDVTSFPDRFLKHKTETSNMQPLSSEASGRAVYHIFESVSKADIFQKRGRTELNCGEIHVTGVTKLLKELGPFSSKDVFVDIGSGIGNVISQVALETNVRLCLGVEIRSSTVDLSTRLIRQFSKKYPALQKVCQYVGDMARLEATTLAKLEKATILYSNNTLFDNRALLHLEEIVIRANNLRLLISFHNFCGRHRESCARIFCRVWRLYKDLKVAICWAQSTKTAYVYERRSCF